MPTGNQAPIKTHRRLRLTLRRRLDDRDLNPTKLAVMLGHDISVISKAINHGRFPRVLAKIRGVLNA